VAALAVLLLPLGVLTVLERRTRDPLYWLGRPSLADLGEAVRTMAGGTAALAAVLAALAVVAWRARDGGRGVRSLLHSAWATLAAWALLPLVGLWTVSLAIPVFQPRYAIAGLPAFCLIAGAAAARLPRSAGLVVLAAVVALNVRVALAEVGQGTVHWEAATHALAAARAPADPVIVDPFSGLAVAGYYDRAFAAPEGDLVVSEWHDRPVPDRVVLLDDPAGYGDVPAGPPSAALVQRLARRTGTVHLLLSETAGQGDVWESPGLRWARSACDVTRQAFDGVEVITMRGCPRT
jgi:hypothetical protein